MIARNRGLTLIEMLIVVAILSIMSASMMALSFAPVVHQKRLEQRTERMGAIWSMESLLRTDLLAAISAETYEPSELHIIGRHQEIHWRIEDSQVERISRTADGEEHRSIIVAEVEEWKVSKDELERRVSVRLLIGEPPSVDPRVEPGTITTERSYFVGLRSFAKGDRP